MTDARNSSSLICDELTALRIALAITSAASVPTAFISACTKPSLSAAVFLSELSAAFPAFDAPAALREPDTAGALAAYTVSPSAIVPTG